MTAADISNAANWTCAAKDKRVLQIGANGRDAGINEDEAPEFAFTHRR